jgi:hypothetical protein
MNKNLIVTITSIICLTILEIVALYFRLDGQIFSFVVALIAGLGGYHFYRVVRKNKH